MNSKKAFTTFLDGFSILMAVYAGDNPSLLLKAINSVLNNSLLPDQFLIVIDGPVGSEIDKILINANDSVKFIDLIYLRKNIGLARALNEGLKHVKFPWVVRADADDYNHFNRFSLLSKTISDDPSLDIVGSFVVEINDCDVPICYKTSPLSQSEIRSLIKYRNPFNHMSVAFKLNTILEVGGYPNIYLKEDYGLWALLISKNAKMKNIPLVLVSVSAGEAMYARRGGLKYVKSEIALQHFLYKLKLQPFFMGIIIGLTRSIIFLLPRFLRGRFYEYFLRKKINDKESN